jgi:hypothetical protein
MPQLSFLAQRRYRAYLLRCWEVRDERTDTSLSWRFSLEDPHTEARKGFANLEALIEFLQIELIEDQNHPGD